MSIEAIHFTTNPLYLTQSPEFLRAQLAKGAEDIVFPPDLLADGINTDTIIPADACKTPEEDHLAEYVLTGWEGGAIKPGEVRQLWPNVWVAGAAFGSGSSREHAPFAMRGSGCGLVVAESFAPMLQRNAVALGLYTSTNFGLLDRIRNGDPIPLEELITHHDPLSRDVMRAGGLLPYLRALEAGTVKPPQITTGERPMTITEKWLAKYLGVPFVQPGDGGFVRPNVGYSYEYTLPLSIAILKQHLGGQDIRVRDHSQHVLFNDHLALDDDPRSIRLEEETRRFAQTHNIALYDTAGGERLTHQGDIGICHVVMTDRVIPGVNVGTDSHTPMIAPTGGYVFGIGATDYGGMILTGKILATVPKSVFLRLHGRFAPYVTARDLMLSLSAQDKTQGKFLGSVIQFDGSSLTDMTLLDLAIIANMTAEARAVTATFPPLPTIARYLVKTGRAQSFDDAIAMFPTPDQHAKYAHALDIDLSAIEPTVAIANHPENGVPLREAPRVRVNSVIIGSCVGGGIKDIQLAAHILKGQKVASHVKLTVHPHSIAASKYAEAQGWLQWIRDAGGNVVLDIGCGACIGNGPGTLQKGDVAYTTASRNHRGRMGDPDADVTLSNSVVCAVAAIIGGTPTLNDLHRFTQQVPWEDKVVLFT